MPEKADADDIFALPDQKTLDTERRERRRLRYLRIRHTYLVSHVFALALISGVMAATFIRVIWPFWGLTPATVVFLMLGGAAGYYYARAKADDWGKIDHKAGIVDTSLALVVVYGVSASYFGVGLAASMGLAQGFYGLFRAVMVTISAGLIVFLAAKMIFITGNLLYQEAPVSRLRWPILLGGGGGVALALAFLLPYVGIHFTGLFASLLLLSFSLPYYRGRRLFKIPLLMALGYGCMLVYVKLGAGMAPFTTPAHNLKIVPGFEHQVAVDDVSYKPESVAAVIGELEGILGGRNASKAGGDDVLVVGAPPGQILDRLRRGRGEVLVVGIDEMASTVIEKFSANSILEARKVEAPPLAFFASDERKWDVVYTHPPTPQANYDYGMFGPDYAAAVAGALKEGGVAIFVQTIDPLFRDKHSMIIDASIRSAFGFCSVQPADHSETSDTVYACRKSPRNMVRNSMIDGYDDARRLLQLD